MRRLLCLLCVNQLFQTTLCQSLIRWGFEAPFGPGVIHGRYDETAEFLSNSTGVQIEVVPVIDDLELAAAAGNGSIQMLQTGSGIYTCIEAQHGFIPLLNTLEPHAGYNITTIAGIIYARADDNGIQTVNDIRGKVVATGPFLYLSTFQAQWAYLTENGIDLFSDALAVMIATNPSAAVIDVAAGKFPVGLTRAGLPEDLQAAGSLKQGLLKVLDAKNLSNFPYATTTNQYPGNKISVSPNMSTDLQRSLMMAFLSIPRDVALVGQYTSYVPSLPTTSTLNMQNTVDLLQFPLKACTSLTSAFEAVTCPEGYAKSSENSVKENCRTQGIDCPVGYTCYCRPCQKVKVTARIGKMTKLGFILLLVGLLIVCLLILSACLFVKILGSRGVDLSEFAYESVCGLSALGPVKLGRFRGQCVVCKTVYECPKTRFSYIVPFCKKIVSRYKAYIVASNIVRDDDHICEVVGWGIEAHKIVILLPYIGLGSLSDLLLNPTVEIPLSLVLRYIEALMLILHKFKELTPPRTGQTLDIGDFLVSNEQGMMYSPGSSFFFGFRNGKSHWYTTAPEVVQGGPSTQQSDMWTLGILMYELLHRRPAYDDIELDDVMSSIKQGVVRIPVIQQTYDVDALYDIVRSCLRRDPNGRPSLSDCLRQIRQIAAVLPSSHPDIPSHLISAMQGDKSVTCDVYTKVTLLCCEIDDYSTYQSLSELAETNLLCVVPTADQNQKYFIAAENLTDDSTEKAQMTKIITFLSNPLIKHLRIGIGLHTGNLRGIIVGDRYSFVGSTMTVLRELQEVSKPDEILCSENTVLTENPEVELIPRPGLIKCRGQIPFRAMYVKLNC